ncbi:MAG: DUF5946 family protein [Methanospirillum sp.]
MTRCPGCRLELPHRHLNPPPRVYASGECWRIYSDLQSYTVAKRDPAFMHQHAVDAYAAQHAGGPTRNIAVAFGLIGLYLALERRYTGRQVQLAHMRIAKARKEWPRLEQPAETVGFTALDVLRARTDAERDRMIERWMAAVWETWADRQEWVRATTDDLLYPSKRYGPYPRMKDKRGSP